MPVLFGVSTNESSRSRGQSSVIGVVLIMAITVLGVTGLLLFGSTALMDGRTQSQVGAAEHAMTQLDSRFSLVALGSAERQGATVDLRSGASMTVDGDSGWMNVSVYNQTSGDVDDVILNTSLGAIRYENDGTTVAYQGGGVWKQAPGGGSVMVSPPEFHYRKRSGEDPTLTLPLVVVRGNGSVPGEATVTKEETIAKFPNDTVAGRTNPLESGQINVTVHSQYYEAWGAFFESRTGGNVEYDHDRKQVRIVLRVEKSSPTLAGGVISGAGNGLFVGQQAVIDSYNSSVADYATQSGTNTSVISAGDVELGQGAEVQGDLVTGGTLSFTGNGQRVHGNLTYGGSPPSDPGKIDGWIEPGSDVQMPEDVSWLIDEREEDLDDGNNDNGANITGTTLDSCSPSCTLYAGDYYLDEIDLSGSDTLVLDTSTDDIDIYVDDDVEVDQAEISVVGGGRARIYVNDDFYQKKGSVAVDGDRAPGLWLYMRPGSEAEFQEADFVGVIYGPGSGAQSGTTVELHGSGTHIYGGVVGQVADSGSDVIGQSDRVHFDEALTKEDPLEGLTGNQPTVTYMHVTVNRVNVTAR